MYLPVISTKISAILRNTNHAFIRTIKRSIKYCFLVFRTSLYKNLSQCLIPYRTSLIGYSLQVVVLDLTAQILFCLFGRNKWYTIAKQYRGCSLRIFQYIISIMSLRRLICSANNCPLMSTDLQRLLICFQININLCMVTQFLITADWLSVCF